MNNVTFRAFAEELEKLALSQEGGKNVVSANTKRIEEAVKKGTRKTPGFVEGVKRNLVATGRRMMNPKDMVRRVKHSLTGPGVPKFHKALAGLGVAATVASAAPKKDPTGEGKSRLRRTLEGVGGTLGGTAGKGWSGGIAGGAIGAKIGDMAGKAIDKVRGYKPPED